MTAFYFDNRKKDDLVEEYHQCQKKIDVDKPNRHLKAQENGKLNSKDKNTYINTSFKYVESLFKNQKLFLEEKSIEQNRVRIKKFEQSVERHDDLYSKLALAALYLQIENQARADQILSELLQQELFKLTFRIYIPLHLRKDFLQYLFLLLEGIETKIKNRKLWDTLLVYLYHIVDKEVQSKLADKFEVVTSPIKIRNMSKSINYGRPYPGVWFPLLRKYFGIELAEKYLEESNFYHSLENGQLGAIWILNDYFPNDKKNRELIWKVFQKLEISKSIYHQDLVYRLLENESFRIFLIKNDKKFQKPMFLEKRKHFIRLLKMGLAVDYALYNLIWLGDYNPSYLQYVQQQ